MVAPNCFSGLVPKYIEKEPRGGPISNAPTVFARSIHKIAQAVEPYGNERHLLKAVGLDRDVLHDPVLRVPYADMMMLSEFAARMTRDIAFGLHVGERVEQHSYGIVGYSVISSSSLGQALRCLERYLPIWTDVGAFRLDVDGSIAHFQWRYSSCSLPEPRHDVEMTMATVTRFNRLSSGAAWIPREVWFKHPKPKDVSEHARIFRAPVRFGMPANALLLDSELLNVPLRSANPFAHRVVTDAAEKALAEGPRTASFAQSMLSFIRQRLGSGEFGLEEASRHLGLSRRTLQRKLREESSSHRRLVDRARRDLAGYLLLGTHATVTEAAYALGFSEPSAFHHAFQKWYGTPPQVYRRTRIR